MPAAYPISHSIPLKTAKNLVLPLKCLIDNDVTDVATFPRAMCNDAGHDAGAKPNLGLAVAGPATAPGATAD